MIRRTRTASINGQRVLVLEDDYMIADDLRLALEGAGAVVVGPAPTVGAALRLLSDAAVDLAVLDIDLGGDKAFAVADELTARGIRFVFASGYDRSVLPRAHASSAHVEKPVDIDRLIDALASVPDSRNSGS